MSGRDRDNRNESMQAVERLDSISTLLIHAGVATVKKYPVPSAMYVLGVLVCLLFNGYSLSSDSYKEYDTTISSFNMRFMEDLQIQLHHANDMYYQHRGWFSCNDVCQKYRIEVRDLTEAYKIKQAEYNAFTADAKQKLGVFSEFGVGETRDLFWTRFGQGKSFAARQSKWDALLGGMRAMGRNEKLPEYLLKLLFQVIFNFTIGMLGAVIGFMWSLYGLIQTYKTDILTGLFYFFIASMAAIAFAMTWLIGMYIAAAGTVYIGAKLMASNLRLGGGDPQRHRMEYANTSTRQRYDE